MSSAFDSCWVDCMCVTIYASLGKTNHFAIRKSQGHGLYSLAAAMVMLRNKQL